MSWSFEMNEEQEVATPEDEALDAEFSAGFTGEATEAPTQPEAQQSEASDAPEGTGQEEDSGAAAEEPAAPEAPAEDHVQITKSQFDELMAKASQIDQIKTTVPHQLDKAFGKIGGIERVLKEMQKTGGQAVQLTDEDFAELKAEYPELAELQRKSMEKVFSRLKIAPSAVNPEAIEQVVSERVNSTRKELIDASLDAIVGDSWEAEVKTPAFTEWMNAQADDVKALADSPSARDAAKMLRLYTASKRTQAAPAPAPAPAPVQKTRQRVIAAAVTPKGNGISAVASSEDDDFAAGFKRYAGR